MRHRLEYCSVRVKNLLIHIQESEYNRRGGDVSIVDFVRECSGRLTSLYAFAKV